MESGGESTGPTNVERQSYAKNGQSTTITMAELRHRQVEGIEKPSRQLGKYQKTPRPPTKRPSRQIHISITLLILACFILYANNQRHSKKTALYQVGGQELPQWYGICSKEGRKIYTVPEDEGVGAVECIVVGGQEVMDTGSLGTSYPTGSELRFSQDT